MGFLGYVTNSKGSFETLAKVAAGAVAFYAGYEFAGDAVVYASSAGGGMAAMLENLIDRSSLATVRVGGGLLLGSMGSYLGGFPGRALDYMVRSYGNICREERFNKSPLQGNGNDSTCEKTADNARQTEQRHFR